MNFKITTLALIATILFIFSYKVKDHFLYQYNKNANSSVDGIIKLQDNSVVKLKIFQGDGEDYLTQTDEIEHTLGFKVILDSNKDELANYQQFTATQSEATGMVTFKISNEALTASTDVVYMTYDFQSPNSQWTVSLAQNIGDLQAYYLYSSEYESFLCGTQLFKSNSAKQCKWQIEIVNNYV